MSFCAAALVSLKWKLLATCWELLHLLKEKGIWWIGNIYYDLTYFAEKRNKVIRRPQQYKI